MSQGQLTAAITDLTGDYQLDPAHTRIGFVARHAMVTKVRGSFKEFDAQVHIDAANPEALPLRENFLYITQGRPAGGRCAAVLGRQRCRHWGTRPSVHTSRDRSLGLAQGHTLACMRL